MTAGKGASCGGEVHRELDRNLEMQPVCQRCRPIREEAGRYAGLVIAQRFSELPCSQGSMTARRRHEPAAAVAGMAL